MFYSTKCTCDHFTEQECIRKDCIIDMSQYHQQCDGSIISLPLRITSNALEQITFCRNSIIIWWSSWSYEIIWDLWWSYDDHMMIIWNHYKEEYYQRQCTVVDHYYSFPLWELHTCCFFTLLHHIFILAMAIIGIKIMISTRVETVSCHYRNQQHQH